MDVWSNLWEVAGSLASGGSRPVEGRPWQVWDIHKLCKSERKSTFLSDLRSLWMSGAICGTSWDVWSNLWEDFHTDLKEVGRILKLGGFSTKI